MLAGPSGSTMGAGSAAAPTGPAAEARPVRGRNARAAWSTGSWLAPAFPGGGLGHPDWRAGRLRGCGHLAVPLSAPDHRIPTLARRRGGARSGRSGEYPMVLGAGRGTDGASAGPVAALWRVGPGIAAGAARTAGPRARRAMAALSCAAVLAGLGAAAPAAVAGVRSAGAGGWDKAIEVPGTAALNTGGTAKVFSVSCAAAGSCTAVGFYAEDSQHAQAFVVTKAGGRWRTAIEVPGTSVLNTGENAEVFSVS